MHNYLQHLNPSESPAETTSKKPQNTLKIEPIINHKNYLISSTKLLMFQDIYSILNALKVLLVLKFTLWVNLEFNMYPNENRGPKLIWLVHRLNIIDPKVFNI